MAAVQENGAALACAGSTGDGQGEGLRPHRHVVPGDAYRVEPRRRDLDQHLLLDVEPVRRPAGHRLAGGEDVPQEEAAVWGGHGEVEVVHQCLGRADSPRVVRPDQGDLERVPSWHPELPAPGPFSAKPRGLIHHGERPGCVDKGKPPVQLHPPPPLPGCRYRAVGPRAGHIPRAVDEHGLDQGTRRQEGVGRGRSTQGIVPLREVLAHQRRSPGHGRGCH